MTNKEYKKHLCRYAAKFDKKSMLKEANLDELRHKMFVEGEKFAQSFDRFKEEFLAFEKVDLIDYWNVENGWTDKKR